MTDGGLGTKNVIQKDHDSVSGIMRVCIAGAKTCPPEIGGIEVFAYELGTRLAKKGVQVTALVPRKKGLGRSEQVNGINVVRVTALSSRFFLKVSSMPGIFRAARRLKPDVFHANDPPSGIVGSLGKSWKSYVLTVHGRGFSKTEWPTPFRQGGGLLQRVAIRRADAVATSDEATSTLLSRLRNDIVSISPGVDPSAFSKLDLERPSSFDSSRLNLVFIGRLGKVKGFDLLLEGLDKLDASAQQRIKLTIIGDGPLGSMISDRKGVGYKVEWLGLVPHESVRPYFAHADILVMPSRSEGLPISMLEAMAAGLPVLSTMVGGINRSFTDKHLTPIDDVSAEGVKNAISRAIEDMVPLRRRAAAAKELVASDYSWDKVTEKYMKLYEKVTS